MLPSEDSCRVVHTSPSPIDTKQISDWTDRKSHFSLWIDSYTIMNERFEQQWQPTKAGSIYTLFVVAMMSVPEQNVQFGTQAVSHPEHRHLIHQLGTIHLLHL